MLKNIATGVSFTVGAFVLAFAMAEPNAPKRADYIFETGGAAERIVEHLNIEQGEKTSLAHVTETRVQRKEPKPHAPAHRTQNVRTEKTMCDPTFPMRGSIAHPACF